MKKWIVLFFIIIYTISFSKVYRADFIKINKTEDLIIGKTTRIDFEMDIIIPREDFEEKDFFYFSNGMGNQFLKIINIDFKSFQYKKVGNKIYFKDNLKEKIVKELDLKFSGTMVFDWKDSSDKTFKTLESLEIGYITDRTNPILLDFDLMTLNPINDVQVKVIEDMNLGVVFAGERLSTKNSQNNGHPAKIEIKGKNKKRVVIKIPKIAKITNEKKDSLDVSLSFRENNSQVLIKEFNKDKGNESNNGMVSLKDILIDGESETSTKNKGTYEGNFIVRVEYEQ
ncbi:MULTISPECIES: hypothetical protein [Fusobacterium]|jgi:hypothetical protein|uniref:DUF4402 domain-containing protein n=2 Tax=Fusobacterium mortiferum TaxID=850 RepID=A0A414PQK7_FUSMR|nr:MULTISPECIES: hypothetical protein [Fusobacterium]AVQ17719.1 hypothetical protein C4N19_00660 [Fusobacterium mortiferum ATCC 9817]EEO36597.1 hypothetical protein FMAG_02159 [Fusobacterium mortiferum ATCC 9817]MCF2628774.1 hypothetical protein [Fusobacterium mortiferum]MCF2699908.1 hypothetical protein [Fusobacterium mortiferum]MCI6381844.1 hypothetical protein [Fusobacterium mortiferum]